MVFPNDTEAIPIYFSEDRVNSIIYTSTINHATYWILFIDLLVFTSWWRNDLFAAKCPISIQGNIPCFISLIIALVWKIYLNYLLTGKIFQRSRNCYKPITWLTLEHLKKGVLKISQVFSSELEHLFTEHLWMTASIKLFLILTEVILCNTDSLN